MESTQEIVMESLKQSSQTTQNSSFIECIPIKQIEPIVINLEDFLSPEELKRWMELHNK